MRSPRKRSRNVFLGIAARSSLAKPVLSVKPLKTKIPDALKEDLPQTTWGKILSATPVVMAVIATMLAGLASSEMTTAQYDRSLAAQQQSKAGDQWNFFQGKKLRGALQQNTRDMIGSTAEVRPLGRDTLMGALANTPALATLDTPAGRQAVEVFEKGVLPDALPPPTLDADVQAALHALEMSRPEFELAPLLAKVSNAVLDGALRASRDHALAFDAASKPLGQAIDAMEKQLAGPGVDAALRRDFTAARLTYNALRYDREARLNQVIAGLYELQVRKSNFSAERHHRRSQKFFYGMLGAQTGVIIATLAIAARKRNLLWSLAAVAGATAIVFAAYVYLYV